MKLNVLAVLMAVAVASLAHAGGPKGGNGKGQGGGGGQGGGKGAAAVATVTKGQTPGQLLADAARDTRTAADLAQISSGLRSQAAAGITSAATTATAVDAIAAQLKKDATYNQTLAQQLLTAGTQRSPGQTKAQLTAQATADTASSKTCANAGAILKQIAAAQKTGIFQKLANSANRISNQFAHDAADATRDAARLK